MIKVTIEDPAQDEPIVLEFDEMEVEQSMPPGQAFHNDCCGTTTHEPGPMVYTTISGTTRRKPRHAAAWAIEMMDMGHTVRSRARPDRWFSLDDNGHLTVRTAPGRDFVLVGCFTLTEVRATDWERAG